MLLDLQATKQSPIYHPEGSAWNHTLLVVDEDAEFIHHVSSLVRYHMHILYILNDLPFANIEGMVANVDMKELGLLGICDRLGRTGANQREEEKNIELFIKKCNAFIN